MLRLVNRQVGMMAAALVLMLPCAGSAAAETSAHDFSFMSIEGEPLPMTEFAGKAVLLVNTASFCGFTPQYEALQALWEGYRDRGLIVLGVPSNDFGGQEPHDEAAIKQFCEANYLVDFPMTAKQKVVGTDAHPLYRWIKDEINSSPRWNFAKYLIGKDGRLIANWSSGIVPTSQPIISAIAKELSN